jgi:ribonuclease R
MLVLRSLERAVYSPLGVGHFALAAAKYCHFTSPIRRYADLTVHRALDEFLAGRVDRARRLYAVSDLAKIGEHLSQTEQLAEDAENEVKRVLVLHLLTGHVGEQVDGVVTSLTKFGASVFLPEYGVEGLLRPEALGADHWQFDEQAQCLIGRHTGGILRLGQNLGVRIVEVHPGARRLDLAPAGSLPTRKTRKGRSPRSRRNQRPKSKRTGKTR